MSAFSGSAAEPTASRETFFACTLGAEPIQIRLALTPDELRRGLMFVQSMPEEEGMLFCYEEPRQVSFWMKNTLIPLQVGYFDQDGKLLEIYSMFARDRTPVPSVSEAVAFALEMNDGWFTRHGVKPGQYLDLKAVAEGMKARGYDPASFGLK